MDILHIRAGREQEISLGREEGSLYIIVIVVVVLKKLPGCTTLQILTSLKAFKHTGFTGMFHHSKHFMVVWAKPAF